MSVVVCRIEVEYTKVNCFPICQQEEFEFKMKKKKQFTLEPSGLKCLDISLRKYV